MDFIRRGIVGVVGCVSGVWVVEERLYLARAISRLFFLVYEKSFRSTMILGDDDDKAAEEADTGGLRRVVDKGRVPSLTELLVLVIGNGDLGSNRLALMRSGDDGGLALDGRGRDEKEEGVVPAVPLRLTPV